MSNKRIGPIKRMAKKEVQKEIKKIEKKEKRKLDIYEKRQVKNQVFKRLRTRAAIFGAVGLLGIGGLTLGNRNQELKAITDGRTVGIEEQQQENTTRDEFLNGIKVDIQNEQNTIDTDVRKEIENLKTPEEVLKYTKQIYVEQYNKENEEKIKVEDVTLSKTKADMVFYKDIAENGDEILRYCSEYDARQMGKGIDGDLSMLKVYIKNENIDKVEKVAQKIDGSFDTVYKKDEQVKEKDKTVLEKVGNVIFTGINRADSMVQENTSHENKEKYKNRFIEAVTEYEENKTNQNNKNKNGFEH